MSFILDALLFFLTKLTNFISYTVQFNQATKANVNSLGSRNLLCFNDFSIPIKISPGCQNLIHLTVLLSPGHENMTNGNVMTRLKFLIVCTKLNNVQEYKKTMKKH